MILKVGQGPPFYVAGEVKLLDLSDAMPPLVLAMDGFWQIKPVAS
jgi:hypothetical protein